MAGDFKQPEITAFSGFQSEVEDATKTGDWHHRRLRGGCTFGGYGRKAVPARKTEGK